MKSSSTKTASKKAASIKAASTSVKTTASSVTAQSSKLKVKGAKKSMALGDVVYLISKTTIKSIGVSNKRILGAVMYGPNAYSASIVATDLGKAKFKIKGTDGFTFTKTVKVTQKLYDANTSTTKKLTKSKYDSAIITPEFDSITGSSSLISVRCVWPSNMGNASGFETYESSSKDFKKSFRTESAAMEWNGLGYTQMGIYANSFSTFNNSKRYVKTRAYRIEGSTKVYGPWTKTKTVKVSNYYTKRSGGAKYSYKLYFLDSYGKNLYSGISRAVYIKTKNPDPSNITLTCKGTNVTQSSITYGMRDYQDVVYLRKGDAQDGLQKVKGGYIASIAFSEAGTKKIVLREYNRKGYVNVRTYKMNVVDYRAAVDAWMKGVISSSTNSGMTNLRKMQAVCDYILGPAKFKYYHVYDGHYVDLVAAPNGPFIKSHRWNSYISPDALCRFAELIGFSDSQIHNCYGDYPRGSTEWYSTHWYCKITVDGKEHYFGACPTADTGELSTIPMIDLDDASAFIAV